MKLIRMVSLAEQTENTFGPKPIEIPPMGLEAPLPDPYSSEMNKLRKKIFTEDLINNGVPEINFSGIPGINDAREKFKHGDLIFDVRLGYQLNHIVRVGFVVNNVFNTEYMSRPANMMPPRTFAVQCNIKL